MKLVNYLTLRLTLSFLVILTIWSAVYFRLQMYEIYDGIDEGLDNLRQEFVLKANESADFTESMMEYNPLNIRIKEIDLEEALSIKDKYSVSKVYFETEDEDEEVRMLTTAFYSEPNDKYYKLKIFTSNVEAEDLSENMFYLLMILWVGLILTLVLSNKIVLNKSNKPFFQLIDRLKQFKLEEGKMIELPQTKIEEFEALNKSVKKLLVNNIRAYSEQKEFIANASHELQTPLAVVISKLELMIVNENNDEIQIKEIGGILQTLNRMKRINSNLLLLSKIQNRQFVSNEGLNLNEVIKEVLDAFEDMIEHKSVQVSLHEDAQLIFPMNNDLAYILFTNLIKNSINYNNENGRLDITISAKKIVIANEGKETEGNKNVFERYVGSDEYRHSLGLGLSIVKAISDHYAFEVEYAYSNSMHTMILLFEN